MAQEKILLVISDPQLEKLLASGTLRPGGFEVTTVDEVEQVPSVINTTRFDVAIMEEKVGQAEVFEVIENILSQNPMFSVIVISHAVPDHERVLRAMRIGITDYLTLPLKPMEVVQAVRRTVGRRKEIALWVQEKTLQQTDNLRRRMDSLKELEKIGRSVTASLEIDRVLTAIVDAAVKLTGAEEGSLLILDENTGDLVMRAARNFQDEFVRTFRLPVTDTLAGQVIQTGVPVLINEDTPQKIKTTYLVRTLIYVPLQIHGKVIGVLGVDNRERGGIFSDAQVSLVSTLADYAAIALENARLYNSTDVERHKLETILTQIEDGVIVIGADDRVMLVNRVAKSFFDLESESCLDKPYDQVFHQEALLELLTNHHGKRAYRTEITLEDGSVLNAQRVDIPDVGTAITIQDITYFKELDRIKSEFVNTVSHDLRSPLTAILGYIELIGRVGEVNRQQREFIDRVQTSVRNITELINDLLDLGRIETGFDARKELVPLEVIVEYAVESIQARLDADDINLSLDFEDDLPQVLGDPVRLRQIVDNLLSNAARYTSAGGWIRIRLNSENDQVILQVMDNGIGIPLADQSFIFDKFYRASNVPDDKPGSGLGLAIVKSIVENHQGRIWVDSTPEKGTCFTVVLPVNEG